MVAVDTAAMIVFGGTLGAVGVSFPAQDLRRFMKVTKIAFAEKPKKLTDSIFFFIDIASLARKEGILALEKIINTEEDLDNMTKAGLQLVADGVEHELIRDILDAGERVVTRNAPVYRLTGQMVRFGRTPLAAGENHYTRFEFNRVIEDGAITILQPDLSKTGGITETLRIAAMASAYKLPIHPHSSMTGLNHAASIHFLAAIDNGGYFEGDVSRSNKFRDDLVANPGAVDKDGNVWPLDKPGLGLEVNEEFLAKHPPIEGPGYI